MSRIVLLPRSLFEMRNLALSTDFALLSRAFAISLVVYRSNPRRKTSYSNSERSDFAFEKLSLSDIGTLTFEKPDTETFRLLPLCIKAINEGGLKPTAVNGANEQAVKLFLEGKIKFLQIAE